MLENLTGRLLELLPFGFFHFFAMLITLCSLMTILSRNPVKSAIFLVINLFLLAGVYALLESHFVAAIQILVYAGAITVLFVFVIMLLNLKAEAGPRFNLNVLDMLMFLICGLGIVLVAARLATSGLPGVEAITDGSSQALKQLGGHTLVVASVLMTKYIWPFEIASFLILLAIIASVVIARKEEVKK